MFQRNCSTMIRWPSAGPRTGQRALGRRKLRDIDAIGQISRLGGNPAFALLIPFARGISGRKDATD
jgi:hypothetical protein